jgi:hypothetical protein
LAVETPLFFLSSSPQIPFGSISQWLFHTEDLQNLHFPNRFLAHQFLAWWGTDHSQNEIQNLGLGITLWVFSNLLADWKKAHYLIS